MKLGYMCYMYQAALWCEDCGRSMCAMLLREKAVPTGFDPDDESSYDSDDFPKECDVSEESDSVQHCEAGRDCLNALYVPEWDTPATKGTAAEGGKVGCWLKNDLTTEGIEHLRGEIEGDLLLPAGERNPVLALHWEWYEDVLGDVQLAREDGRLVVRFGE